MAGAGPSRRSHTKSRTGCKTCKRRHIRCDESFPQCRNCTKHQVRCDYMENLDEGSTQGIPEPPAMDFPPDAERSIDLWLQTGRFPFPALNVFPPPQAQDYTRTELRLIHHICTISSDLSLSDTNNLTTWSSKIPRLLGIATQFPFVMHALLSFSANHLAWMQSSTEIRNLHIQHGSVALRGLHEAIGNFSEANADAILTASLLMIWQATDWRSWSSLKSGIQSVLNAMQSWRNESLFSRLFEDENLITNPFRSHRRQNSVALGDRAAIYHNIIQSLQKLQMSLAGHDLESHWVEQLLAYIHRLQSTAPAQTQEEQFNHAYLLRKWLFWVPISLLQRQGGKGPAMLALANFYATAISLEPLFPDLGPTFCAALALPPLEAIIQVTNAMQTEQGLDSASLEVASLMQFAQQAAFNYRVMLGHACMGQMEPSLIGVNADTLTYTTIGNLSPAFSPSTPTMPRSLSTTSDPTYLAVPSPPTGFGYVTSSWGVVPSPGFPPQTYGDGNLYDLSGEALPGLHGGFVSPPTIWT